jgi:hypothetical protein
MGHTLEWTYSNAATAAMQLQRELLATYELVSRAHCEV